MIWKVYLNEAFLLNDLTIYLYSFKSKVCFTPWALGVRGNLEVMD